MKIFFHTLFCLSTMLCINGFAYAQNNNLTYKKGFSVGSNLVKGYLLVQKKNEISATDYQNAITVSKQTIKLLEEFEHKMKVTTSQKTKTYMLEFMRGLEKALAPLKNSGFCFDCFAAFVARQS